MPTIRRVHHVALVVDDIQAALTFWRDGLGLELSQVKDVPDQESRVAFLPISDSQIELVLPTSADSGVARFLAKRGPGMHHVCLEVEDLDGLLARLKAQNIRLINVEPLTGQDGRRMAFIHPESTRGVLVELYEAA